MIYKNIETYNCHSLKHLENGMIGFCRTEETRLGLNAHAQYKKLDGIWEQGGRL